MLEPLNDVTIDPGQTISFSAAAADGDLPANGLTYSLTGPPAGAAIHPLTGAFRWRPFLNMAGTAQTISVNVSDNGTPPASHSRSFTVTVRPLQKFTLSSTGFSGGVLHLRLDGPVGPDYTLQRSPDMVAWETVTTQTPGTMPLLLSDVPGPGVPRRFYRVQAGPFGP